MKLLLYRWDGNNGGHCNHASLFVLANCATTIIALMNKPSSSSEPDRQIAVRLHESGALPFSTRCFSFRTCSCWRNICMRDDRGNKHIWNYYICSQQLEEVCVIHIQDKCPI